jgi:hypothetical protein
MAAPVILAIDQYCDADGNPYAGGTIATYIPGTSTPKQTWLDPDQIALNTNPLVLDAAGRGTMWGDGLYRIILRDSIGNLIFDVDGTTIVSAAMAPVVAAPTIADALVLLGLSGGSVADEAAARAAADSAEQLARIAADTLEANTRATNITDLQTALTTEANNRIAADAALQAEIDALTPGGGGGAIAVQAGTATIPLAAVAGMVAITFPTPFATACTAVVCTCSDVNWAGVTAVAAPTFVVLNKTTTGANVYGSPWDPGVGITLPIVFNWVAVGH